jgi:hypothetical protein
VFSALINIGDAGDLADTDFFMRNVKGVLELNVDFQGETPQSGEYYTGHLSKENYLLVGIDAAF